MVQLASLVSTIALVFLSLQPVTAQEWYVLGVKDDWTYERATNGNGYNTHDYSVAAKNMNTNREEDTKHSQWGRSTSDLCGASLFGAEVWCFGDITKECQGYEVAAFKSRRCRTYCPSIGDKSPLYNYNWVTSGSWFRVSLVCDKPYP